MGSHQQLGEIQRFKRDLASQPLAKSCVGHRVKRVHRVSGLISVPCSSTRRPPQSIERHPQAFPWGRSMVAVVSRSGFGRGCSRWSPDSVAMAPTMLPGLTRCNASPPQCENAPVGVGVCLLPRDLVARGDRRSPRVIARHGERSLSRYRWTVAIITFFVPWTNSGFVRPPLHGSEGQSFWRGFDLATHRVAESAEAGPIPVQQLAAVLTRVMSC